MILLTILYCAPHGYLWFWPSLDVAVNYLKLTKTRSKKRYSHSLTKVKSGVEVLNVAETDIGISGSQQLIIFKWLKISHLLKQRKCCQVQTRARFILNPLLQVFCLAATSKSGGCAANLIWSRVQRRLHHKYRTLCLFYAFLYLDAVINYRAIW